MNNLRSATKFINMMAVVTTSLFLFLIALASEAKEPPVATKYYEKEFDNSVDALPKNFKGHDARAIFKTLVKNKGFNKTNFESDNEYAERIAKSAESIYLTKTLPLNAKLAFVIDYRYSQYKSNIYHANSHVIHPASLSNYRQQLFLGGFDGFLWDSKAINRGNYIGSNAYGVSKRIRSLKMDQTWISFNQMEFVTHMGIKDFRWFQPLGTQSEFPMSPEDAMQAKDNMNMLLIGTTSPPYYVKEHEHISPTLDKPNDADIDISAINMDIEQIWFFDSKSGRIYHRLVSKHLNAASSSR
ncbi:MAG: hypothetical protein Q8L39_11955 [Burkholderiales bacterium]|nr:hypothetical protein [Burkholderiales bacterium]